VGMGIPPWNGPTAQVLKSFPLSRGPALIETQSAVEHDLHVAEVVQPRAVGMDCETRSFGSLELA